MLGCRALGVSRRLIDGFVVCWWLCHRSFLWISDNTFSASLCEGSRKREGGDGKVGVCMFM